MINSSTEHPRVVSRDEWLAARKAHLATEKALTKARDKLAQERRELPWVRVNKSYVFHGPDGKETLADLFHGRSQLIVYQYLSGSDTRIRARKINCLMYFRISVVPMLVVSHHKVTTRIN
jgi:predicted dithiol-disulfide oxidoreductase (DUF899 family)